MDSDSKEAKECGLDSIEDNSSYDIQDNLSDDDLLDDELPDADANQVDALSDNGIDAEQTSANQPVDNSSRDFERTQHMALLKAKR